MSTSPYADYRHTSPYAERPVGEPIPIGEPIPTGEQKDSKAKAKARRNNAKRGQRKRAKEARKSESLVSQLNQLMVHLYAARRRLAEDQPGNSSILSTFDLGVIQSALMEHLERVDSSPSSVSRLNLRLFFAKEAKLLQPLLVGETHNLWESITASALDLSSATLPLRVWNAQHTLLIFLTANSTVFESSLRTSLASFRRTQLARSHAQRTFIIPIVVQLDVPLYRVDNQSDPVILKTDDSQLQDGSKVKWMHATIVIILITQKKPFPAFWFKLILIEFVTSKYNVHEKRPSAMRSPDAAFRALIGPALKDDTLSFRLKDDEHWLHYPEDPSLSRCYETITMTGVDSKFIFVTCVMSGADCTISPFTFYTFGSSDTVSPQVGTERILNQRGSYLDGDDSSEQPGES